VHVTESNTEAAAMSNPADLSLTDLRELRQQMQHEDDVVSYARRVAQARLDIVKTAHARRDAGPDVDISGQLERVLSHHLTGGPARPPRPTEDLADNDLADELDSVCAKYHFGRLEDLDDAELEALSGAIAEFEAKVSSDRRERFDRLDALSAELVRRYRDGEASIDSLHTD
jgi:RsiG-like